MVITRERGAGVQAVTAATATTKPQTEEEINKIN
jgi:hypothetical protein